MHVLWVCQAFLMWVEPTHEAVHHQDDSNGGQGLGAAGGGAVYEAYGPVALPIASVAVLSLATLLFFISKQTNPPSKAKTT